MKRKQLILIVVCAALFASFLVLEGIQGWSEAARKVQVYDVVRKLSMELKMFKNEQGRYPYSLLELGSTNSQDEATQDLISITQKNRWHDTYESLPAKNGFTIIVSGPEPATAGWFGAQRKAEKYDETWETLENLRNK